MGVLLLVSPTERLSVRAEVKKERSTKGRKEETSEGPNRGRKCICKIT